MSEVAQNHVPPDSPGASNEDLEAMVASSDTGAVSYTHLTLPTTPYV